MCTIPCRTISVLLVFFVVGLPRFPVAVFVHHLVDSLLCTGRTDLAMCLYANVFDYADKHRRPTS